MEKDKTILFEIINTKKFNVMLYKIQQTSRVAHLTSVLYWSNKMIKENEETVLLR